MKIINNIKETPPRHIRSRTIVKSEKTGNLYLVLGESWDSFVLVGLTNEFMRVVAGPCSLDDLIRSNNLVFVTNDFDIVLNNPAN